MNKKKKKIKVMVDMTCSILHHGHTRLIKQASKIGEVIIALTSDSEVKKVKKFTPPLNFVQRRELLLSLKYVSKVVKSKSIITDKFLKLHKCKYLVHGSDNFNKVSKKYLKIFNRTKYISSSKIRIGYKVVKI